MYDPCVLSSFFYHAKVNQGIPGRRLRYCMSTPIEIKRRKANASQFSDAFYSFSSCPS